MSSPGLRERKKQKTRWAIQEHAVRLFAQQGYDATTVEQIAEAAEISPSTFFRYFKTKEDLVIQDRYDDLMIAAIEAAPPGLSALATMRYALLRAFKDIDATEQAQIWQRSQLQFSVPALRARSLDNMLNTINAFTPPLARRLGRDPDDFAVRVFVGAVIGGLMAGLLEWVASDGSLDLYEVTIAAFDVMPNLDIAA